VGSHVVLVRGINLGPRNRIARALRELFTSAGFEDMRTYARSGEIVLSSAAETHLYLA
jgi:uncharacterized protein (DUF1697 family)